jgi:hypothetical protein
VKKITIEIKYCVIFSNSFLVLWKEEKKCFEQSKDRLAILYNESLQKVKHFLRTPKERFLVAY